MKRHVIPVAITALASRARLVTLATDWSPPERRAGQDLLEKLALAEPGVHLSEIGDRLGRPMGDIPTPARCVPGER